MLPQLMPSKGLLNRYLETRRRTLRLCKTLATEDFAVQASPEVSPTKWHLAHTSWFFETFILKYFVPGFNPFHPQYEYLFNSYYESAGTYFCRPKRGTLSRPTVKEILNYRSFVDEHIFELLSSDFLPQDILKKLELGIHHEQQHQELLLTDIKFNFWSNPLRPSLLGGRLELAKTAENSLSWKFFEKTVSRLGHSGDGFAFDNEKPVHQIIVHSFQLANRLVTNAEFLEFMEDNGYSRPELWLSDGWKWVKSQGWNCPLYWEKHDRSWQNMTLFGMQPVHTADPVSHISYYEADAYARWAKKRLPIEAEWELPAKALPVRGNFLESGNFKPLPSLAPTSNEDPDQLFGDLWEWTASPYTAYPGYVPFSGALGEYNSKFMCNQFVLRGGSFATPVQHIRPTYRNFFQPEARWQFTGLRLANSVAC